MVYQQLVFGGQLAVKSIGNSYDSGAYASWMRSIRAAITKSA